MTISQDYFLQGSNVPYETCCPTLDTVCRQAAPAAALCNFTGYHANIGKLPYSECCPHFSQHCKDAFDYLPICKYYVRILEPSDGPGGTGELILKTRYLTEEEFQAGRNPAYPTIIESDTPPTSTLPEWCEEEDFTPNLITKSYNYGLNTRVLFVNNTLNSETTGVNLSPDGRRRMLDDEFDIEVGEDEETKKKIDEDLKFIRRQYDVKFDKMLKQLTVDNFDVINRLTNGNTFLLEMSETLDWTQVDTKKYPKSNYPNAEVL